MPFKDVTSIEAEIEAEDSTVHNATIKKVELQASHRNRRIFISYNVQTSVLSSVSNREINNNVTNL